MGCKYQTHFSGSCRVKNKKAFRSERIIVEIINLHTFDQRLIVSLKALNTFIQLRKTELDYKS
jgi:hypothetical protein